MVTDPLIEELTQEAVRTEPDYAECIARLKDPSTVRLLHVAMGLVTESAEFLDVFKKYIFYGKPIDKVNLKEELGDSTWYQRIACDELHTNILEEMVRNVRKLRARYPEKFEMSQAITRDLVKEREILESNHE